MEPKRISIGRIVHQIDYLENLEDMLGDRYDELSDCLKNAQAKDGVMKNEDELQKLLDRSKRSIKEASQKIGDYIILLRGVVDNTIITWPPCNYAQGVGENPEDDSE